MSSDLATALRATAARLRLGADYQWGHFGACNCGHLAQTITDLPRAEIHRAAVESARDWGDATVDYCPASGLPIDHILGRMLAAGLTLAAIKSLEELDDRRILARLPGGRRHLRRNAREDVVLYLETWAELLDEERATFAEAAE